MSKNKTKGRLSPFVPLIKDTLKTEAWKALSHGARSLYAALKGRYNIKLQNAVWLSVRDAAAELGSFSHTENVRRWFRELAHYGFIVMVSPAHHGVNGPTFSEKRNRSRGRDGGYTLTHMGVTLVPDSARAAAESDSHGGTMSESKGDSHGGTITTLTTGYRRSDLLSGYEAMWSDAFR
jgi:hypothetical protein